MKVSANSLPALLIARSDVAPGSVATRSARSGIWHEQGWSESVRATALVRVVMIEAGVGVSSVVAIATSSRAEWLLAVCAAQSLGAVVLPVALDADHSSIQALHGAGRCALWVVEDEEQHDKVVEAGPADVAMLVLEPRGVSLVGAARAWSDVVSNDDAAADAEAALRSAVATLDVDTPAMFVATKTIATDTAVEVWTHRRLAAGSSDADAGVGQIAELSEGDEYLSFLPTDWPIEQRAVLHDAVVSGAVVSFGERVGGVLADLGEVQPTVVQAPAELWDSMALDVLARSDDVRWSGRRALEGLATGRSGPMVRLAAHRLRRKLGLRRLRLAVSLGAPADETRVFFTRLGIDLMVGTEEAVPTQVSASQEEPAS